MVSHSDRPDGESGDKHATPPPPRPVGGSPRRTRAQRGRFCHLPRPTGVNQRHSLRCHPVSLLPDPPPGAPYQPTSGTLNSGRRPNGVQFGRHLMRLLGPTAVAFPQEKRWLQPERSYVNPQCERSQELPRNAGLMN
ncbi:hypothetical protein C2845_PM05G22070 [Panicum miliaceum]|uniref:Uncharacterized protein n=1 Tax=Panicum miliaceum TaxID=4540 RepID=A0A3L6T4H7_PANMI|nr:hypothetical protein C2845_PM05G22070 [Panicum miliaceum]